MRSHPWEHLGKSGSRIYKIVGNKPEGDQVSRWQHHLSNRLPFPFRAIVASVDEVDDYELLQELPHIMDGERVMVMRLGVWDDFWGFKVDIEYRGEVFDFPLCDLSTGLFSSERRLLADYQLWWLER